MSDTISTLQVTGMTCGHCVSAVSAELSAIAGVSTVHVDLEAGGVSTVTVTSTHPLDPEVLAAAVDEAGYALTSAH